MQEFESHPGIFYPEKEWENFINTIKHKVRYCLFDNRLRIKTNTNLKGYASTHMIPSCLIDIILKLNPIKELPINSEFFRARVHKSKENISSIKDICSPPYGKTTSQRISPYGISYFYGATNRETAIIEVRNQTNKDEEELITSAKFTSKNKLILLDFSLDLEERKSEVKKQIYGSFSPGIEYLKLFIEELQKPIDSLDDKVHLEYLPTQFLLEYIRLFLFNSLYMKTSTRNGTETKTGKSFLYSPYPEYKTYNEIDGICYKSTKNEAGKCYCLFFSHEDFLNDDRPLELVKESVKTISK